MMPRASTRDPASSPLGFDFEALKFMIGPAYTQKRDAFLRETPEVRTRLSRLRNDRDWRTRITASILLAWLDHGRVYEKLLRDMEEQNWASGSANVNDLHEAYAERIERELGLEGYLPLCWEMFLKRYPEWEFVRRFAFVLLIEIHPDERSLDPLFDHVRRAPELTSDEQAIRESAFALRRMPKAELGRRLRRLKSDEDEIVELAAAVLGAMGPGGKGA
jgi:hypothetical protein